MSHKMSDLNGIDQNLVAKLRAAGVETTSDMMTTWLDPSLRTKLTASAGLDEEQVTRMASMARMARTRGVGPKYADLLVTAGVIGRKSLSKHTPEGLLKHLAHVRVARTSSGAVPTLREVEAWFAELKPLDAPQR